LLWDTPEQRVHYELLAERAVAFFSDRSLSPFDKERIDYEVRTALFLHRDAAGYYNFIHRSFLEFFVARTLRHGLARGDRQCLNLRRLTREVAFFLELWPEREKIPELAASVLTGAYQQRVSENALVLLHPHCRAGLAPLAGPGSELHEGDEGLDQLRRAFAEARPRQTMQLAGADFSGAELRGVDLGGAVLQGTSFERAELRGASLAAADLAEASLRFADARRASFAGADLTRVAGDHADFQDADLEGADLTGADLRFSRFARADLHNTVLAETQTAGAGFLGARGVEVPAPQRLRTVPQLGHAWAVNSVAWHPREPLVASGSADGTVKIRDALDGRLILTLEGHRGEVNSVAWDASGERLASGSDDRTVKIWEAVSGRLVHTLEGHENGVLSVAWDASGERLASGSSDRTVKIWEAVSGRLV
ncbi:MAG: hypothetical protein GY856_49745, partial [bacterium]|nr:hypothetical protein [bacterium]